MEIIESKAVKTSLKRELNHAILTIEAERGYKEDYQIRMLRENKIEGLLHVRSQEEEGVTLFEYDISGKVSMKSLYEKNKINAKEMKKFLEQISGIVDNLKEYLLDANKLLVDPEYIFCEKGNYYFCYYPLSDENIGGAFHRLMDSFVQWTDYQDTVSVKTAFMLHKETMEENYSINKILEQLREEEKEEIAEKEKQMPDLESAYETAEHDWITSQEMGSRIMKETDNLWTPVRRFLQKHKKPKWGDWDGIYIEEEEL